MTKAREQPRCCVCNADLTRMEEYTGHKMCKRCWESEDYVDEPMELSEADGRVLFWVCVVLASIVVAAVLVPVFACLYKG